MNSKSGLLGTFYLRFAVPLAAKFPAWLVYGLALCYADIRSRFSGPRFQEVTMCLQYVVGPKLSERNAAKIARRYFRNMACNRVDIMRLAGDGRGLSSLVNVDGEEYLKQALAQGKGAILCSGHYGSIRVCGGLLGVLGYPVTLIANWSFSPNPSQTDSTRNAIFWTPIRPHMRRENLSVSSFVVAMQAAIILREDEAVLTTVDAEVFEEHLKRAVKVRFLKANSPVLPGPTELSTITGARLLTVFMRRSPDWRHQSLEIRPVHEKGPIAMQEMLTSLETVIRADPAQWAYWDMRRLVPLNLFPEESASDFYRRNYGHWWEWD